MNALFDYRAASNEEFSFSQGDVIAVTATDVRCASTSVSTTRKLSTDSDACGIGQPDGWWQGQRVGDNGNSKLFPSKSVSLPLSLLSL